MVRDVRPPRESPRSPRRVPGWLALGLRVLGLVAWLWIVVQLVIGGSSDADVASLFLWVYGWVGVAMASALVGPVWAWLNPFTTLFDLGAWLLRRLGIRGWEPAPLPERLGIWPAVIGFTFFVWLELAASGAWPGLAMAGYTAVTLVAMAQFGRDRWLACGETFSVWFGSLGRLAPFALVGDPSERLVRRRGFASGLREAEWTLPHVVLVALGTGAILYDGISQSRPWVEAIGFPGVPTGTLLLAAFLALLLSVILAVGRRVGIAALGAGLLPIAVGYVVAHYLTYLLSDGQRLIVALSDPFQLGWDLLDTAFHDPDLSWLPPEVAWTLQLAAVVGGHVVGAWSGHAVASQEFGDRAALRRREIPLALLMIALTATTLWSLGEATVVDPASEITGQVTVR